MNDTHGPPNHPLQAHLALSPLEDSHGTVSSTGAARSAFSTENEVSRNWAERGEYETLYFDSSAIRCEAWLLRPADSQPTPLVLMAHGLAAEKSFGLLPYARHFVERGIAVLLFDYRHFGGSGGEPRNLVDIRRQQQDWQAALDFATTLPGITPSRIGLWGTSLSGGHALACAVHNPAVAAVVAQSPMLDIPSSLRGYTVRYAVQAIGHSFLDLLKMLLGRKPHLVPVVGSAPKFAVMNKPGCENGYWRNVPCQAQFQNAIPARILLKLLWHRPSRLAWRVNCPALLLLQAGDQLVPRRSVHRAAAQMRDVAVVSLGGDHFDVYFGGASFDRAVQLEADFFQRILCQLPASG